MALIMFAEQKRLDKPQNNEFNIFCCPQKKRDDICHHKKNEPTSASKATQFLSQNIFYSYKVKYEKQICSK